MLLTLGAILCALENGFGNTYSCYTGSFLVTSSAFYYTTNLLLSLTQFLIETKIGQIILSSFLWSCIYFMACGYQVLMNDSIYYRPKPIIFIKKRAMLNDVHEQEMSKLVSYHYGDQDQLEEIDDIFTSEKKPLQLSVTYNHDSEKYTFVPKSIDTINKEPSSEIEMTTLNEMHDENKVIDESIQEKIENNKNENQECQEIISREIMQESKVIDELIPEKIESALNKNPECGKIEEIENALNKNLECHEKIEENEEDENALSKNLEYYEKIEENENSLNQECHKKIEENEENENALNQEYHEEAEENENASNNNLEYNEKIENEKSLNLECYKKIEENEENENVLNQEYNEKIEENEENENALNKECHEEIEENEENENALNQEYHEKIEENEGNENALNQECHEKIEENEENENGMNKNSIKDREIQIIQKNNGTQVTRVEKSENTTIYSNPDSSKSLESEPDSDILVASQMTEQVEKEVNAQPNSEVNILSNSDINPLLKSDIDTQPKSNMNEKEVNAQPNSVVTKPAVYEPFTEVHVAPPSELFLADAIFQLDQEIEQITEYEKSAIAEVKEKEAKGERDQEYEFMKNIQCGLKRQIHILNYQKLQYEIQQKENALSPKTSTILIPSFKVVTTKNSKKYANYIIMVQQKFTNNHVKSGWVLARRYNEFYTLYDNLKKKDYKCVKNFKFPEKTFFPNINNDFLESRQIKLNEFLQVLISDPKICNDNDFKKFLYKKH